MEEKEKIVVFVQARMASTRLPAKVAREVLGKPMILHQVERIQKSKLVDAVVVITSINPENDLLEHICTNSGVPIYRGSENDLLDRHYQAAKLFQASFVIKIPSDCPLADPGVIDRVISLWKDNPTKYDYVSNYHPPSFPDGLDVEGAPFHVLEKAWIEADKNYEREHTFPYIWDNPVKFRIGNVENQFGNMFMTHRWTLDYEEDFEFISKIYNSFKDRLNFDFSDVLLLLKKNPELSHINSKYAGVNWYRHHEGELKTVLKTQYKKEL